VVVTSYYSQCLLIDKTVSSAISPSPQQSLQSSPQQSPQQSSQSSLSITSSINQSPSSIGQSPVSQSPYVLGSPEIVSLVQTRDVIVTSIAYVSVNGGSSIIIKTITVNDRDSTNLPVLGTTSTGTPNLSTTADTTANKQDGGLSKLTIALFCATIALLAIIICVLMLYYVKRKRKLHKNAVSSGATSLLTRGTASSIEYPPSSKLHKGISTTDLSVSRMRLAEYVWEPSVAGSVLGVGTSIESERSNSPVLSVFDMSWKASKENDSGKVNLVDDEMDWHSLE
ncbi:hypothetical protein HK096_008788, partial [Nowakowskiella sp. JEL0078]